MKLKLMHRTKDLFHMANTATAIAIELAAWMPLFKYLF